jgi:hypothetical protein
MRSFRVLCWSSSVVEKHWREARPFEIPDIGVYLRVLCCSSSAVEKHTPGARWREARPFEIPLTAIGVYLGYV